MIQSVHVIEVHTPRFKVSVQPSLGTGYAAKDSIGGVITIRDSKFGPVVDIDDMTILNEDATTPELFVCLLDELQEASTIIDNDLVEWATIANPQELVGVHKLTASSWADVGDHTVATIKPNATMTNPFYIALVNGSSTTNFTGALTINIAGRRP